MKKFTTKLFMLLGALLFLGTGTASAHYWSLACTANNFSPYIQNGSYDGYTKEFTDANGKTGSVTIHVDELTGQFRILRNHNNNDYYAFGYGFNHSLTLLGKGATPTLTSGDKFNFNGNQSLNNFNLTTSTLYNVDIILSLDTYGYDITKIEIKGYNYKNTAYDPTTVKQVYLVGNFDSSREQSWDDNKLSSAQELTKNENGIWTAKNVKFNTNGYFKFRTVDSNNQQTPFGALTTTSDDRVTVGSEATAYVGNYEKSFHGIYSASTTYDVDFWFKDNRDASFIIYEHIEIPDQLYIYGHLNDNAWVVGNYVQMEQSTSEPWIFTAKNVDVSGRWNQHDVDEKKGELNGSTNGENYIAFFDHIIDDMKNQGYKYGGSGNSNTEITQAKASQTSGQTESIKYRSSEDQTNFKVFEGIFDIEVNFKTMQVTFNKKEKKNVTYNWFYGDDDEEDQTATKVKTTTVNESGEKVPHYSFTLGGDKPNRIQVGVGDDPMHRAARQASYEVRFKPAKKNQQEMRRRIDVNDVDEEGYYLATEGENGEYNTVGSDEYLTNHLIELTSEGEYKVTAKLTESDNLAPKTTNAYNVEGSVLYVTANGEISFTSDELYQSFVNGNNTFAFTLDNTSITSEDFTVTFTPATEGWPTSYEALSEDFQNEVDGITGNIDGVYTAIAESQISISGENGKFTATVTSFPCSGVYKMNLVSKNSTYVIDDSDENYVDVTVYPNLLNVYDQDGSTGKLNVNGIPWEDTPDYKGIMKYPIMEENGSEILFMQSSLAKSRIYTPGLYFADLKIRSYVVSSPSNVNRRRLNDNPGSDESLSGYTSYELGGNFDLSGLGTAQNPSSVVLYVYASKNGAYAPINNGDSDDNFIITPTSYQDGQLPTGVDTIGVEEGEAVYFNLQGVRVANPEHGIFVKVQNGKATKVVM